MTANHLRVLARRLATGGLLVLLAAAARAQSITVPIETYTSGTYLYAAPTNVTANSFTVGGSASVTFTAGTQIMLMPGFQATAASSITTFVASIAAVTAVSDPGGGYSSNPDSPSPGSGMSTKEFIYFNGRLIAVEESGAVAASVAAQSASVSTPIVTATSAGTSATQQGAPPPAPPPLPVPGQYPTAPSGSGGTTYTATTPAYTHTVPK